MVTTRRLGHDMKRSNCRHNYLGPNPDDRDDGNDGVLIIVPG